MTNEVFLSNPSILLWRFEVIYSFSIDISSSSSLNFLINSPPRNGSCSISPTNGTSLTLFTVWCPDWFDEDEIKDYSLFLGSSAPSSRLLIAFSPVSIFDVRLPASVDPLRLFISIRDREDCVTEWTNLSSISVRMDSNVFDDLLNSFVRLLTIGNQNEVGQVLISLSSHLNQRAEENLQQAISSRSILHSFSFSVRSFLSRRSSCREPFHLSVGFLLASFVFVSGESFGFGAIRERSERSRDTSRVSQWISRQSADQHAANDSNSIAFVAPTHSIDE